MRKTLSHAFLGKLYPKVILLTFIKSPFSTNRLLNPVVVWLSFTNPGILVFSFCLVQQLKSARLGVRTSVLMPDTAFPLPD